MVLGKWQFRYIVPGGVTLTSILFVTERVPLSDGKKEERS